jgi:hypothetical protein
MTAVVVVGGGEPLQPDLRGAGGGTSVTEAPA